MVSAQPGRHNAALTNAPVRPAARSCVLADSCPPNTYATGTCKLPADLAGTHCEPCPGPSEENPVGMISPAGSMGIQSCTRKPIGECSTLFRLLSKSYDATTKMRLSPVHLVWSQTARTPQSSNKPVAPTRQSLAFQRRARARVRMRTSLSCTWPSVTASEMRKHRCYGMVLTSAGVVAAQVCAMVRQVRAWSAHDARSKCPQDLRYPVQGVRGP